MRALFIDSKKSAVRLWLGWLGAALVLALCAGLFVYDAESALQQAHAGFKAGWVAAQDDPMVSTAVETSAALPPASPASDAIAAPAATYQEFIEGWATHWSSKNTEAYLSAYAPDFAPEGTKSRDDWAREHKQRISSKSKISVQIRNLTVLSSNAEGLSVNFNQIYEADGRRSTAAKTLLLTQRNGTWKIQREFTP